ncbi:Fanconi anemia core complex-associated protein 20 isoform X1 [Cricetulus griseus]|uniref:Fanconi anemia core complex-associated protein 20 isoform X1 n=1 Tax=Cricetulus griseus TaxID=10029 RepID=UPI0004549DFF|nr:Fanconi anemia core complex-associated protein 20 isoform X1 [Cricetulus griseus]
MALGTVGSGGLEAAGAGPGRRAGRVPIWPLPAQPQAPFPLESTYPPTSTAPLIPHLGLSPSIPHCLLLLPPPTQVFLPLTVEPLVTSLVEPLSRDPAPWIPWLIPLVLLRAPNCRPWFLLEGSKSEPWAALLRSSVSWNVDLTPNSQPLPPLPAFPSQESLPDPEPTVAPEVFFTVGSKTFSWTPFPPALGVSGNSYRLFHGTGGSLESPTPPLRACPAPDSTQTPGTQECVSVHSPPALLSCPLCQKAFDPTLAQMDVDSHLAQCLAESTEDVVW